MVMNIFNCSYLAINEIDKKKLYITFKTFNLSLIQNRDSERKVKKMIYSLTFLEGSNIKVNEAALITSKWREMVVVFL